MSLFFYLHTFAINLWHRKFVTADVIAVLVHDQHCIQRRLDEHQIFGKNCTCNQYEKRLAIFNTENIKICAWI